MLRLHTSTYKEKGFAREREACTLPVYTYLCRRLGAYAPEMTDDTKA